MNDFLAYLFSQAGYNNDYSASRFVVRRSVSRLSSLCCIVITVAYNTRPYNSLLFYTRLGLESIPTLNSEPFNHFSTNLSSQQRLRL